MSSATSSPWLSRTANAALSDQLAARLALQIDQGLLAPGSRLPSIRACAQHHGVSPSTVVTAYDKLQAQGLAQAFPQRGFFVRESAGHLAAGSRPEQAPAGPLPRRPLPISATTLMRGMFQAPGQQPMPGLGTLPIEWLDLPMLSQALKKVCNATGLAELTLQYGEPAGDLRLRRALALLLGERGVTTVPEQLVTTVGATHALDVVTRSLLRAGDTVLVDEPGWSVEFARLRALGMRPLAVPRLDDGPDLEVMGQLIEAQPAEHRPRLYVTVSVLHNPTGGSISLQKAHRLLQFAQQHSLFILEDDSYAHLAPPHLPRLAALDALERTILVGGFSKILAPSFRVGFIAAPKSLVDRFVDTKLLSTLSSPALTEQALASCLESGRLRRHAERIRQKLDAARARSVQLAEAHNCRFAAPPRGLFGWLDVGCDTERLALRMHDDGWLLAPGSLFFATPRPGSLMRINFATTQQQRFWQALVAARRELAGQTASNVGGSART
ncbi:PLP-dependent aminotransferase family protein [Piscinibacter sakaiensis]|uniref:aminotransferase-like domain-containing protein n=1 Tax=Piscinibacter sakaiensis TaxID=1547922 RepID=UPI003AAA6084